MCDGFSAHNPPVCCGWAEYLRAAQGVGVSRRHLSKRLCLEALSVKTPIDTKRRLAQLHGLVEDRIEYWSKISG